MEMDVKERKKMFEIGTRLKLLGAPRAYKVIKLLHEKGPMPFSQIVEILQIEKTSMSDFLYTLKRNGLLETDRVSQFVVYKLKDERLAEIYKILEEIIE